MMISSMVLVPTLSGCGSTHPLTVGKPALPKTLQAGATVSTSVVYIRPWADIADGLSPKFPNTADNALGNVLTSQSFSDFRLLRSLGISAQAGVQFDPISAVTDEAVRKLATKTTGDKTETVSDTTDRTITTRKVDDDTPPSTGDLPAARTGSASALADQIGAARAPSTEPFFRYSTASALYQEIGLLNDAVAGIPGYEGKKPYIIRLRVGVQPYRRDLPWDVYAHLMLADGGNVFTDAPILLPILSSEAFEGNMDASAMQRINEIRMGLQALAANAKVSGGFSKLNDNLTAFLTRTYSPSLQVTGTGGQTIDVRFSASKDKTGYALTSRNFYVTVVAYLDEPKLNAGPKKYRFHTNYEARDAERGTPVLSNNSAFERQAAEALARSKIFLPKTCSAADFIWYFTEFANVFGVAQAPDKLTAQYAGTNCVSAATVTTIKRYSFLLDALAARRMIATSSFPLELPARKARLVQGVAPLVQDGVDGLMIDIPYEGPDQLPLAEVVARLSENAGPLSLQPRAITLKSAGSQRLVHLEFPPLSAFQAAAKPAAPAKKPAGSDPRSKPDGWRVDVDLRSAVPPMTYSANLAQGYVATVPKSPVPEFIFASPLRSARLATDGLLAVSVYVKLPDGGKVKLTAKDAEILDGGIAINELAIPASGMRTISLRNAIPGQTVTITATATLDADAKAKTESSIAFLVQPPLATK